MIFRTTLYVNPKGKARHRTANGRAYTPKEQVDAEAEIRWLVKKEVPAIPWIEDDGVYLKLWFFFKKPKSCKRDFPTVKPDFDNLAKTVSDALNAVLWQDDKQVVDCDIKKRYAAPGESPRIVIEAFKIDQMEDGEDVPA